ncbi:MAG: hypothetical protein V3W34_04215 [Phycisphaerae bacterium]
MFQPRLVGGFFARFVVYFLLLMFAWQGVAKPYGAYFRFFANTVFGKFGTHGEVRFEPIEGEISSVEADTQLLFKNRRTGAEAANRGRSGFTGYQPTAFVIALILSTPIRWSRRLKSLGWGLLLVHAFIGLRILILLLGAFSNPVLGLFELGAVGEKALGFADWVLVKSFAGSYAMPVGIWFLATFRRSDWAVVFKAPSKTAK